MRVAIIGVPSCLGGPHRGPEQGPASLRQAGLVRQLRAAGLEVQDVGDLAEPSLPAPKETAPGPRHLQAVGTLAREVRRSVTGVLAGGMVPLVLGGDHSVALGSIAASAQRDGGLGLVWIDAHPDFNTPQTSPTGNVHGMVLALVAGLGPAQSVKALGPTPLVPAERIVILGTRTIDPGERDNLQGQRPLIVDGAQIAHRGISAAAAQVLECLEARGVDRIHLSVDLDVLDPEKWRGVSTPAAGGLSVEQLAEAVSVIAAGRIQLAAMDVVELNPERDLRGRTAEAALQVIEAALVSASRAPFRPHR